MAERQSSLTDIKIEDPELEEYLQTTLDNAEAAVAHRTASRQVKELLKTRHSWAVNSDDDGEHSGWVICGNIRFRPRNRMHAAETVEFERSEGVDWQPLEIERL